MKSPRYLLSATTVALLLFALPGLSHEIAKAQTPPAQLELFDTFTQAWRIVDMDSIGTGTRHVYAGSATPTDSAEVAYGSSGNAAAWRAVIGGEAWAKTMTQGTFPVSVRLGEIEYYLAQNPAEWERLQALMFDREQLGFIRFFGVQGSGTSSRIETIDVDTGDADITLEVSMGTLDLCTVTDLEGNCLTEDNASEKRNR